MTPSTTTQPAPRRTDGKEIWPLVIEEARRLLPADSSTTLLVLEDMAARDRLGRERYGTPLQAGNGRDTLLDLYQEQLDACVYARAAMEEIDDEDADREALRYIFERTVMLAMLSRRLIRNAAGTKGGA